MEIFDGGGMLRKEFFVGCIMGFTGCNKSFLRRVSNMGHICPMSYLQRGVMEVSKTNTFTLSRCVHHHPKCILQFFDFARKLS